MAKIIVIAEDMRSTHNVGALLRTCDGLGVHKVYLCGITPYPRLNNDTRLPHIAQKLHNQIRKTALGAEESMSWEHTEHVEEVIQAYRDNGWRIACLEQASNSLSLKDYKLSHDTVLILGTEVTGVKASTMQLCDDVIEIPMHGKKESFNVVIAAAMALYALTNQ